METEEIDFIREYNILKGKYNLPDFEKLARDFDVEKVFEKETGFLLREVRRAINDKISGYLHLFETLINPAGSPMFIFSILRNITSEDKEKIKEIYKTLSIVQIKTLKLDTIYNEADEAKFIKDTDKLWDGLKIKIFGLIEHFEEGFDKDNGSQERGYFN